MSALRFFAAQINPTVGDLAGNVALHQHAHHMAAKAGADLVVFPEMSLAGYPPDDLALNPDFLDACEQAVVSLAALTQQGPAMLLGAPLRQKSFPTLAAPPLNAAWLLAEGRVQQVVGKRHLPSYEEFYDTRIFASAMMSEPMRLKGVHLGVMICEDVWFADVAAQLKNAGAQVLVTLNASPFAKGKASQRLDHVLRARVRETGLPLLYVNMVGGQDELVFDGGSLALHADGAIAWQAPAWQEDFSSLTLHNQMWEISHGHASPPRTHEGDIYQALLLACRDYWRKNGCTRAVVGLSGGIDSALVAALLVDALGPEQVQGMLLPSHVTSHESNQLAQQLAHNVGMTWRTLPIETVAHTVAETLKAGGVNPHAGHTFDNVQSRTRGVLLMAATNAQAGTLLASTGNKSEVALGYCTLYGDTNGGFNPLKDVYKIEVYALAHWRNAHTPHNALGPSGVVIPPAIITRTPTAETRADQSDEKSLGYPYALIDQILTLHVDDDQPWRAIVAQVGNEAAVRHILALVQRAQYKRQQACPGPKISRRAFGRSRQYPIVNRFNPFHDEAI